MQSALGTIVLKGDHKGCSGISRNIKCYTYRTSIAQNLNSLLSHLRSYLAQDMRNATLSLNSEPKYYPIEVLLKNQNQELPEDVNPAKKEVSS